MKFFIFIFQIGIFVLTFLFLTFQIILFKGMYQYWEPPLPNSIFGLSIFLD